MAAGCSCSSYSPKNGGKLQRIGKNQELALSKIRVNDTSSGFYIPEYSTKMNCEEVARHYQAYGEQINYWSELINQLKFKLLSGDKKEAENIAQIIDIQAKRMQVFEQALTKCSGDGYTTPGGSTGEGSGSSSGGGTSSNTLLIGGGLLLVGLLFMRKRKK